MVQNVLENETNQVDGILSSDSLLREGNKPSSLYTVPLLLLIGFALNDDDKNKTLGPETTLDKRYKEEILSLLLESRPAIVESADSTKSFAGRYGATGFSSRGGRGSQRGRAFTGQINGTGRRSIVRQPNENLWDMPCSEMSSMTLGDIREAENKMKAEDLTLDQYVERQKESNDKKLTSFPQQNQKKSFVSIPISGEAVISVNNTFSFGNNSAKNYQGHITNNINDNFQHNSNQFNQQQHNRHNQQNKDSFMSRFGQNGVLNPHNNTNTHKSNINHGVNASANLCNELIVGKNTNSSPLFPTITNDRKSSSISEAFLNGPANLSLFDVNTPIFDDDNNETTIEFRPSIINNNMSAISSFEDNKSKNSSEQSIKGQTHFEQGIQSSASNFSWSNRNSNSEDMDNKNITNLSDNSTSFPALSKNSQFNQPQVKIQNSHSSISSEPNILQKLHAAGIASKMVDKNIMDNIDHGNLNHSFFESKSKQHKPSIGEYPPLSSASNVIPPSFSSPNFNNLKFNNQSKSNDAGRLLMSIIGAGQQNNNRNYATNFNVRNNNHRNNIHNTHNAHNSNYHNNGSHHNDQIDNFARY